MANEKRLIDADALLKELRQELRECQKDADEFGGENILWAEGIEFAIDTVKQTKTVDAVEVVRCKDCKHYGGITFGRTCRMFSGMNTRIEMPEHGFCSHGERITDGKDT